MESKETVEREEMAVQPDRTHVDAKSGIMVEITVEGEGGDADQTLLFALPSSTGPSALERMGTIAYALAGATGLAVNLKINGSMSSVSRYGEKKHGGEK